MFRYRGLIDFSALVAEAGEILQGDSGDGLRSLVLPGLQLCWAPSTVDVAWREGLVALATGRARAPVPSSMGEASRWIDCYLRHQSRAADNLGGGFAAIIVDVKHRVATAFVDRFSIETLCYRFVDGRLEFSDSASDVPGSRRELNTQSLYDYLYFHVIPAPQTVYSDVLRLEPAHLLTASNTSASVSRYWRPEFIDDDSRNLPGRLEEFVETVRSCVAQEADEPATACFLSGGTDSSTIAGMMTGLRDEPVHAYSIGFEAQGYDEMAYARIAARRFSLIHHEHYVTADDVIDAIPMLAGSFDQPFGNSSVLPAYYCAKRAKDDGFSRMLAGDGGDELFAGNSRYAMQMMLSLYRFIPRSVRSSVLQPLANRSSMFRSVPGLKHIGGYVRHAQIPMPDRLETFNLLLRIGAATFLDSDFLRGIDVERPREQQQATWDAINAKSLINHMLAYDWKFTLADSDLPKVRTATALAGLSVGYPFLGRPLTDFSLRIPPRWKLKRLKLRWFFKQALKEFLPTEILRKKKHGFGLPFGPWLVGHDRLREFVEDSLDGVAARGFVRPQFVSELLKRRIPEAPGYYGELAWILMMLEQWIRSHQSLPVSSMRRISDQLR